MSAYTFLKSKYKNLKTNAYPSQFHNSHLSYPTNGTSPLLTTLKGVGQGMAI
jgi:hypothetical protein